MQFIFEWKKVTWWYWLVSVLLLAAGLIGVPDAFYFLIVLCFIQVVHFGIEDKSIKSFTVQMRLVVLGIALLCYWEPLRWLYWLPFLGILVNVLFGYCLLARVLALAPWNRKEKLSIDLVKRTIFSPPVRGSILDAA